MLGCSSLDLGAACREIEFDLRARIQIAAVLAIFSHAWWLVSFGRGKRPTAEIGRHGVIEIDVIEEVKRALVAVEVAIKVEVVIEGQAEGWVKTVVVDCDIHDGGWSAETEY